jgi:tripartite-type tricarboxylate transporter receptor subunit TctC
MGNASNISRRTFLAGSIVSLAAEASRPAAAETYPIRPIHVIVPFGAGGPTDVFTRVLTEELRKSLGQPFVMENRPGAGTVIGTEMAAKSAPDGYTLLMMSATQTVNETLITAKQYHLLQDFVPVAQLFHSELVMVVHPSVGVDNVKDFIALAKQKPGQLNYASSGIGSNYHMAGELFKNLTGTDIVHVAYRGSSGARTDILGGQVQMMFDSIPTMAPFIQAGKVKALGTTGKTRSVALPEVPTLDEAGVPGYEATIWIGMVAPKGTPRPIVELLNREINKITTRPDIKESWEKQDAKPDPMTPQEFGAHIESEVAKWAKLIKTNKIQPN